ncbi:MAG: hypothetical protein JRE28_16850 [Deltaproteobacteria bacterium]|nr:hypothetical protein [Deltaproteobacteria bacterium]
MNVIQALVWNVGTLHVMLRENPISDAHEGDESAHRDYLANQKWVERLTYGSVGDWR